MRPLIRLLRHEDAPALAFLEKLCFSLPWNEAQCQAAFCQKSFAAFGLSNGAEKVSIVQAKRTYSWLLAYISIYHTSDELEILNLGVRPDLRRKGYGRRLLRLVLHLASKMGIKNAILEVRESNKAALALYASLGFVQVGRRRAYYPDTLEDALVLGCPLVKLSDFPGKGAEQKITGPDSLIRTELRSGE